MNNKRTIQLISASLEKWEKEFIMICTEAEFFDRGRRIAQLADAGKPILKQTILSFDVTNER